MPFVANKNIRIYYQFWKGKKDNLIFLHGWPHNHTVWNKEIVFLRKRGYSCIAIDIRGHGKSTTPSNLGDFSFDKLSSDVLCVAKNMGIRRAVIIGHSFGGMIALSLYDKSLVKGLVLVDTLYENPLKHMAVLKHFNITPLTEHVLKFIIGREQLQKKYFPYVNFSKFKDHSDFYFWLKGAQETALKSVLCCLEDMLEFSRGDILPKIKVPTLIIEGEKDFKTSLADVISMSRKIKNAELVVVPKAYHDTNIRNPKQIEHILLNFLKKHFV